jgi:hypothetical protein
MKEKGKSELHEGFIRSDTEFYDVQDMVAINQPLFCIILQLKINHKFNRDLAEILDNKNEGRVSLIES